MSYQAAILETVIKYEPITKNIMTLTQGCPQCKCENMRDNFCPKCGTQLTEMKISKPTRIFDWDTILTVVSEKNWHIKTEYNDDSFVTGNNGYFLRFEDNDDYFSSSDGDAEPVVGKLDIILDNFKLKHDFLIKLMEECGLEPKVYNGLFIE